MKSMQGVFVSGEFQNGMVECEVVIRGESMLFLVLFIKWDDDARLPFDVKNLHPSESFCLICPSFRTNWGRSCPCCDSFEETKTKMMYLVAADMSL